MNQMQDLKPPTGGPHQPLPTAADPEDWGKPTCFRSPSPSTTGSPVRVWGRGRGTRQSFWQPRGQACRSHGNRAFEAHGESSWVTPGAILVACVGFLPDMNSPGSTP